VARNVEAKAAMRGRRIIDKIEPTAYVDPRAKLGRNNYIGHYAVIEGNVTLGDNNYVGHHCVIGTAAQNSLDRYEIDDEHECADVVIIGSNNVIREFSTVHRPMLGETRIGDDCYLMAYSHISHDTHLADGVVLANNVQIGGHTHIERGATVGLSVVVHQFSTIGAYAMVGMGSVVPRDIPPFVLVMGNPLAWGRKTNAVGMARSGFSPAEIEIVRGLFASQERFDVGGLTTAIREPFEAFRAQSRRRVLSVGPGFDNWIQRPSPREDGASALTQ
jgi:UDP-N-acetylglucosamine acyltransferase